MPLFVGGPHDGEWHAADTHHVTWTLAVVRPISIPYSETITPSLAFDTYHHTYERMMLCGEKEGRSKLPVEFILYKDHKLSVNDVMDLLLRCYTPQRDSKP